MGLWRIFGGGEKIVNLHSSGRDVVAFGDSLVYGVGSQSGGGFVKMLSDDLHVPIINLGVSGNTTKDALGRVSEIGEYRPKTVIILLGGNDFLRRVPEVETFKNLEEIILQVQGMGANVVLLGVRSGVLSSKYDEAFEELSKKLGTLYVPDVLDNIFGHTALMSDPIHPNDLGYRIIADKVEPVLKRVLSAL